MKWKIISPKDGDKQMVYAGWEIEVYRGQPPRVDGWSIVLEIETSESTLVTGRMVFPERAHFEFEGSFGEMLTVMRDAEGGRALFAESKFEFWRL